MVKLKYILGLYSGKAARLGLKIAKRKGSYMPGVVSAKIDPNYLANLPKPNQVLAVTGTNGKTTTSNMLLDVLSSGGKNIVNNSQGSNTKFGILTALASNVDLLGKKKSELAILEIDERWTPIIFQSVTPDSLTVTNLYQDSYKRNAHTDFIKDTINGGIPKSTKLILNADDLISSQLGAGHERVFFSIAPLKGEVEQRDSRLVDIRYCPVCGDPLQWDFVRYHHIGKAHCPGCGFTNQKAKYEVTRVDYDREKLYVEEAGEVVVLPLILGTTEAIYNQLAAYSTLREAGMTITAIKDGMSKLSVVGSRFNKTTLGNRSVYLISAKGLNPIANSRVFDSVRKHPGKKTVIISNDDEMPKKYVEILSWLYDTDYQYLAGDDINRLIINSWRSNDVFVRALMAGIRQEKIRAVDDYKKVAEQVDLDEPGDIFILHDIGDESIMEAHYMKTEILKKLEARL